MNNTRFETCSSSRCPRHNIGFDTIGVITIALNHNFPTCAITTIGIAISIFHRIMEENRVYTARETSTVHISNFDNSRIYTSLQVLRLKRNQLSRIGSIYVKVTIGSSRVGNRTPFVSRRGVEIIRGCNTIDTRKVRMRTIRTDSIIGIKSIYIRWNCILSKNRLGFTPSLSFRRTRNRIVRINLDMVERWRTLMLICIVEIAIEIGYSIDTNIESVQRRNTLDATVAIIVVTTSRTKNYPDSLERKSPSTPRCLRRNSNRVFESEYCLPFFHRSQRCGFSSNLNPSHSGCIDIARTRNRRIRIENKCILCRAGIIRHSEIDIISCSVYNQAFRKS